MIGVQKKDKEAKQKNATKHYIKLKFVKKLISLKNLENLTMKL
ncbi:MAG: hypothetical protein US09_C0013G0016 [Candidatus Moranbacteria bacterium GW2011_GWD1_36_198]|nr:MAG: hypothetical protein US09_C0013G0016 [Candidatus Moranbacteria bacterium GW2011_GWD1_36_198]